MAEPVVEPVVEPVIDFEALYKKSKLALDKKLKETGDLTKQLRAKNTAEENEAIAKLELEDKLKLYERKETISSYEKALLGTGFESKVATDMAENLADGDISSFIKGFEDYKAVFETNFKDEYIKSTPVPPKGDAKVKQTLIEKYGAAEKAGDVMSMVMLQDEIKKQQQKE